MTRLFTKTGAVFALLCLLQWLSITQPAFATDLTGMTSIRRSGLVFNRLSNTFDSTATITNVGQQTIHGSLRLFVTIMPSPVTLANKTGIMATGVPFIDTTLPSGSLNQGQSLAVLLRFNNPGNIAFNVSLAVDGDVSQMGGLPPDPGPAGDTTLLGIDSDQDGVRDDVQRYIAFTYPNSEKTRRALQNVARNYQVKLTAPPDNRVRALEIATESNNAQYCVFSILGRDGIKANKLLGAQLLNTATRLRAHQAWDAQLAGQIFRFPDELNGFCPFDPAALPN